MATTSAKFSLVEFKDGIQLVSESWLVEKGLCLFPKYPRDLPVSYDEAVRTHVKPTHKWAKYKVVRTFGTYDDYERAKIKLNKAIMMSDIDTDDSESLRHGERLSLRDAAASSDDSTDDLNPRETTVNELPTIGDETIVNNLPNDSNTETIQEIKAGVERHTMLLERCIGFLQKIDQRLYDLNLASATNGIILNDQNEWHHILPAKNAADVNEVEELLKNIESKKQLVNLLTKCGGTSVDDSIRRVLKEIFSNELACEYSWKGRKGKKDLSSMAIVGVMYAAIKNVPSMTKEKFETRLKEWFRHAPARVANAQKQRQNPVPT